MKKTALLCILFFLGFKITFAQHSSWQFQINYGLTATTHLGEPLQKYFCREGCPVLEQTPGAGHSVSMGISKRIGLIHSLYAAVGYSEIRFHEKGLLSSGGAADMPYERDVSFGFLNLQVGHLLLLERLGRHDVVLTNSLLAEHTIRESYFTDYLKTNNFSYLAKLGMVFHSDKALAFTVNATFRAALSNYNRQHNFKYFDDYKPYGFGLEAGIRLGL